MDQKRLISLLQRSAVGNQARTPFCPDDHDIAGFVDGTLNSTARRLIERHLPDCQACVSRIGLLTRLQREQEAESTPRASRVDTSYWKQTAPQWAIAASVILAVAYLAGTKSPDRFAESDPPSEYQSTRDVDSVIARPEILAPKSGAIGSLDGFVIRWTDVPGSLYYEVRVVSDVGDLITMRRVDGTRWAVDRDLGLEAGREYYIRVDAYLADAQPIRSEHIPFRLRD